MNDNINTTSLSLYVKKCTEELLSCCYNQTTLSVQGTQNSSPGVHFARYDHEKTHAHEACSWFGLPEGSPIEQASATGASCRLFRRHVGTWFLFLGTDSGDMVR